MDCRCVDVNELHGDDAAGYAEQHLIAIDSQPGGQWLYRCPITAADWIYDFPRGWDTGHRGRARLRRVELRGSL
jgi:hypothetical protein